METNKKTPLEMFISQKVPERVDRSLIALQRIAEKLLQANDKRPLTDAPIDRCTSER